ncbi:MAG: HEPN domain-containing protein [Pirellulales bacterium]
MNPLTLEWVQKAEADFEAAQVLSQSATPLHDAVCFHAQQCIEKYLKAWLQEANVRFPRSHDLEEMLDLIIPTIPAWNAWRSDFVVLTTHAVEFRYPGKSANAADAQNATRVCLNVRTIIRPSLGFSV